METVYKPLLLPTYFINLFYTLLCQHFCESFHTFSAVQSFFLDKKAGKTSIQPNEVFSVACITNLNCH